MRNSQLKAFHAVAVHGGFSRAAAAMNLTQPAISDQVRKLEQDYDVLLFSRHNRQVTLTPQGSRLLDIIRPMFEIQARAAEYLSESRAQTTGRLRIIADSAYHVTGVLSQFSQLYPGVQLSLRSGNSAEVEDALANYDADIGVLGTVPKKDKFLSVYLGSTPIVAFAARSMSVNFDVPLDLTKLAKLPLVLRENGSKTRQKLEDAAKAVGTKLTPAIEAEGREAVREIVAAGAGIGFVSQAEYGQDNRLVSFPIDGPSIPMEETVVCIRARAEVRLIRTFMGIAKKMSGRQP